MNYCIFSCYNNNIIKCLNTKNSHVYINLNTKNVPLINFSTISKFFVYNGNQDHFVSTVDNKTNIPYCILFNNLMDFETNDLPDRDIYYIAPYNISVNDITFLKKHNKTHIYDFVANIYTHIAERNFKNKIAYVSIQDNIAYIVYATVNNKHVTIDKIVPLSFNNNIIYEKLYNYIKTKVGKNIRITYPELQRVCNNISLNDLDVQYDDDEYSDEEKYVEITRKEYIKLIEKYLKEIHDNLIGVDKILYNHNTKNIYEKIYGSNKLSVAIDDNIRIDNYQYDSCNYYLNDCVFTWCNDLPYEIYDYSTELKYYNDYKIFIDVYSSYKTRVNRKIPLDIFKNMTYSDFSKICREIPEDEFNIVKEFDISKFRKSYSFYDNITNTLYNDYTIILPYSYLSTPDKQFGIDQSKITKINSIYSVENYSQIIQLGWQFIDLIDHISMYNNPRCIIYNYICDIISYYFDNELNFTNKGDLTLIYNFVHCNYSMDVHADERTKVITISNIIFNTDDIHRFYKSLKTHNNVYCNRDVDFKNTNIIFNQQAINNFLHTCNCPSITIDNTTVYGVKRNMKPSNKWTIKITK